MEKFKELLLSLEQKRRSSPMGALKWCSRCGRKHRSREGCRLIYVEKEAKSGAEVERLVHVERATL